MLHLAQARNIAPRTIAPSRRMLLTVAEATRTLGVAATATAEEVKAAYRDKVKAIHPDVNPSVTASDDFRRATEAFELLLSNERKGDAAGSSTQGPAMDARWSIRRRHVATEYPSWFTPPSDDPSAGSRSLHTDSSRFIRIDRGLRRQQGAFSSMVDFSCH